MAWRTIVEAENERTQILELEGRGCLVRVVVCDAQDVWTPATMTWCPGLAAADFADLGASSAPADVSPPATSVGPTDAPSAATSTAEPVAAAAAAAATAAPEIAANTAAAPAEAPAPEAPDLLELLRDFSRLQAAAAKVFRSKVRQTSGELGYLENEPRVGTFSVPGEGDWVWRIDDDSVLLTSRDRLVALPLPQHLRDEAFGAVAVSRYLSARKQTTVSCRGSAHGVDVSTIDRLLKQLCNDKALRLFRSQPKPVYTIA